MTPLTTGEFSCAFLCQNVWMALKTKFNLSFLVFIILVLGIIPFLQLQLIYCIAITLRSSNHVQEYTVLDALKT